jgi:BTB/POZ domain
MGNGPESCGFQWYRSRVETCWNSTGFQQVRTVPMGNCLRLSYLIRARFYNSSTYSDVTVKFSGHQIVAHKLLLSSQSKWFAKAFEGKFKVRSIRVIIPEICFVSHTHDYTLNGVFLTLTDCSQGGHDLNHRTPR